MSCYLFRLFLKRLDFGKCSSGFVNEFTRLGVNMTFSNLKIKGVNWDGSKKRIRHDNNPIVYLAIGKKRKVETII